MAVRPLVHCAMCDAPLRAEELRLHELCCISIATMIADGPVVRCVIERPTVAEETAAADAEAARQREKVRRWRDRFGYGGDEPGRGSGTQDDPLGPPWDTRGDPA